MCTKKNDKCTISGKRRRGRQKTRWKDLCKRDMESVGLREEDILDRTSGRMIFNTIPATPDDGKAQGEEEEEASMCGCISFACLVQ